jgi:predicted phage terminase large subunit-like protein
LSAATAAVPATAVVARETRARLVTELKRLGEAEKEYLRRAILIGRRLDILSETVLGLTLQPMHRAIQQHYLRHTNTLVLAFRGSGKTTTGTVVYAIYKLIQNRNARILITSKTRGFAKDILKEIKGHLEGNELLIDLFGEFKGDSWSTESIEVKGRTRAMKEPSIGTVGLGGQAIGLHWDIILGDDLVDEDNCRTEYLRERFLIWYYKQLLPTLEPMTQDYEGNPVEGEIHLSGTRYHPEDHYNHLATEDEDFGPDRVLVIPALDESETRTPWPEKMSVAKLLALRRSMGTIIFQSQYQCRTDAMKGDIFLYDWIQRVSANDVPEGRDFIGVDLAIKQQEHNDYFAMVWVRRVDRPKMLPLIFVMRCVRKRLSFPNQVKLILAWVEEIEPEMCAVENNAYQDAMVQQLKSVSEDHQKRIRGVPTLKDKVTRAHKRSSDFEDERVFWVKDAPGVEDAIDNIVAFPEGNKDIFDGLDIAMTAALKKKKVRRKREHEPGLITGRK